MTESKPKKTPRVTKGGLGVGDLPTEQPYNAYLVADAMACKDYPTSADRRRWKRAKRRLELAAVGRSDPWMATTGGRSQVTERLWPEYRHHKLVAEILDLLE